MDVLRAAEGLPRARSELPLEKSPKVCSRTSFTLESRPCERAGPGPSAGALRIQPRANRRWPSRSAREVSSSVMIPEWSRPPRPFTRIALKSSWTTAVAGKGTPSARADSMISPRSLKCRSILKPGL